MPDCYFLTISHGSALDRYTDNWTLFRLAEKLSARQGAVGKKTVLPIEIHSYWLFADEELGRGFEWRMVFITPQGEVPVDELFHMSSTKSRSRMRAKGLPVVAAGQVILQVEWRPEGDLDWQRCDVYWPMEIEERS